MECSENAFWAITPTPKLPQSKPLYPQVQGSDLNTCFAFCRRNANFLSRCAGEMHTSCSYTSYQESGTTAQTVNGADMPIA